MGDWIRFGLTAVFLIAALFGFTSAVIGANRFGYVMNRLHAAGIGDTLGIFGVVCALFIAGGVSLTSAKMAVIIGFLWFTSPVSSHFLSQIEYYTNPHLFRHMRRDFRVRKAGGGQAGAGASVPDADAERDPAGKRDAAPGRDPAVPEE